MANHMIPATASDVLLHPKTMDKVERVAFPFTRYGNVIHAPQIITDKFERHGAPFYILRTGTVTMTEDEIRKMCGNILKGGDTL